MPPSSALLFFSIAAILVDSFDTQKAISVLALTRSPTPGDSLRLKVFELTRDVGHPHQDPVSCDVVDARA